MEQPMKGQAEFCIKRVLVQFLHDESGGTAIEDGLIAAGISIAIAGVLNGVGSGLNATFKTIIADLAGK
jgi:pilus assembly protein Flp/PilA